MQSLFDVPAGLAERLNRPLRIGRRRIANRLVLAPMTQLGHVAYRHMVSRWGGFGLLFSEMCNAKRIPRENREESLYFRWRDAERDHLVFQIFGAEPEIMAEAARRIEAEGLFGVDINFGCSVALICRQNCGAALLKDPELAEKIVDRVRGAVSIPVFVKFRTGWKDDPASAVALAKRFENAGADALTFHPRVSPDRRSRPPKWAYIRYVKESVSIPVLGNGNVFTGEDCLKMLETTGCDGVAVGRIAIAQPWIFSLWSRNRLPDSDVHVETARQMACFLSQHYSAPHALRRYKKFITYFSANFRFGHTLNSRVSNAETLDRVENIVTAFLSEAPDMTSRPNQNLFV